MMRDLAREVAARMPLGVPLAPARVDAIVDPPPRIILGRGRLMADVAREIAAQMPAWDARALEVAR